MSESRYLRHVEQVALHVAARDEIETIHPAGVDGEMRVFPLVTKVARQDVGRVAERDGVPRGNDGGGGAISPGERPEVIVERAVLFQNEHDVLDFGTQRDELFGRRGGPDYRNHAPVLGGGQ